MRKKVDLRSVASSGDLFVDWIFKQFVILLRDKNLEVKRPMRIEGHLMGYADADDTGWKEIGISSSRHMHKSRDEELNTFVHELCHLVCWYVEEEYILQLGTMVMKKLSKKQRQTLKSLIPRKVTEESS